MNGPASWVALGRIGGAFGVLGWVKIVSHTEPRENILAYSPWRLSRDAERCEAEVVEGRRQGKAVIAKLRGVDDRDAALALTGFEIAVAREQLPPCGPGEFYWTDLEGLTVVTREGEVLGTVDHLIGTGANDVLVVEGERQRLIPFVIGRTVCEVDLAARRIEVDWDPDF
jgi:16S rRNA processing protein RimM